MLTPNNVRTAIVLCKRAPLKGEEAEAANEAITALEALFNMMTTQTAQVDPNEFVPVPEDETEDDDTGTDQ